MFPFVSLCAALTILLCVALPASSDAATSINYSNFPNSSGLTLNGAAEVTDGVLRLTPSPAANNKVGSAYSTTKINTHESFESRFKILMHGGTVSPADGMAFVIQSQGANAVADSIGGSVGYSGISPIVAVEFDTWNNGPGVDPPNDHIGITSNGYTHNYSDCANEGGAAGQCAKALPFPIFGAPVYAWVQYDAPTQRLQVFASQLPSRPGSPLLEATMSLAALGDTAYVGFTASTGGATAVHEVHSWQVGDAQVSAPPSDKRPTVTKVHCNYVVATASDTCFAQVGDAGPSPGSPPAGSVKFFSGNGGVFRSNSCLLVPTPASPNVSSCSVEYLPPSSSFPKVAGTYQGSTTHSSSAGATTFYILGGLPDGLGVDFGDDPTLGGKSSSPIALSCSAPKSKSSARVRASLTISKECYIQMIAEAEARKNKFTGTDCAKAKTYLELKNCNPNYEEALEEWERLHNIDEETEKLDEMIKKRSDLYEELIDIMKEYDKTFKDINKGMKSSHPASSSRRRTRAVVLGKVRVRVKAGKQKTVRIKLSRRAKKLISFPRRLNRALPTLRMPVNTTLKMKVTVPSKKKNGKPKRKTVKRVVPFSVSP